MAGREQANASIPLRRLMVVAAAGIGVFLLLVLSLPRTKSPATVDVNTPDVELAGVDAFNHGDYATALPLLREASFALRESPARRGMLLKMIRTAQKELAAAAPVAASQPAGSTIRTAHPPPVPGQVRELTIRDLGNFTYDAANGGNIPEDVRRLSGSRVRVTGYMMPANEASRVTQFDLVPSLYSCCFSQPPGIEHTIRVTCDRGVAITYCPDEVTVEGVLTVAEHREDGMIVSLFDLRASRVAAVGK